MTIQSWRSNGGVVLRPIQYERRRKRHDTHLNFDGKSFPAHRCNLAFGDSSPGLPWNLANCAISPLRSGVSSTHMWGHRRVAYFGSLLSHFMTSCHACSLMKLWMSTTMSILSSGVSHPFLTKAL